jgi:hypothetical protein
VLITSSKTSIADGDNKLHLTKIGAKPINIAPNESIKK